MSHPSPFACPRCEARMTYEDLSDEVLACEACSLHARLVLGSRAVCEQAGAAPFIVDLRRA